MKTVQKAVGYLYFKYSCVERKAIKLFEFWDMYIKWCKVFNETVDEEYKKRTL